MELIHANASLVELRQIVTFEQWDAVLNLYDEGNDFQLDLPESEWNAIPVEVGHYIYEPDTEFGGRVLGIKHVESVIQIKGRTWRGLLIDKVVKPPGGSAYKTITSVEANAAILDLVGTSMGSLFAVSAVDSGITVSGSFRYQTLLWSLTRLLGDSDARLKVTFDGTNVELSAVAISDLSANEELSQDLSSRLTASLDNSKAYNHVIALGSGELELRTVVDLYRAEDGTISTTPNYPWVEDRQIVLDYPNAESTDELTAKATELLSADYLPIESVELDVPEDLSLNLGDIVGGRDYVTGLAISKQVTQIIRRVNSDGETVQYKVG